MTGVHAEVGIPSKGETAFTSPNPTYGSRDSSACA
jgi:hypothetical protein